MIRICTVKKSLCHRNRVFLSGFVMNRIGIADFAIAMVFLGGFVVNGIGIADCAKHGGSGGGGGGGGGGDGGDGG